jgi:hypothetical protein
LNLASAHSPWPCLSWILYALAYCVPEPLESKEEKLR